MFPRNLALISLVLGATLWVAACQAAPPPFQCTDKLGCVTIGPDQPIKIGVSQALSGGTKPLGTDQLRSIELAVADRSGALLGHPLQLQTEDDKCSKEGGTTTAQKIVTDRQIVAILGTTCSGAAVTEAKVMSEAGLVMISGANTAPSLTAISGQQGSDWQPGYFRTSHNDAGEGQTAATFAFQKLGVKTAATINDGDAYTRGLTGVFGQVFTELGGQIVLDAAINKGDTDMKPVLDAVAASGAQLVFFPLFEPEGNFITRQAKQVKGFEHIILMGADAIFISTFITDVGLAGKGMYFVGPATPSGPAYEAFLTKYKSKYGEAPLGPFHAHAYDATNLLFEAITKIASKAGDGTLHLGRQALRDALYATSGYKGLTGTLSCDKF